MGRTVKVYIVRHGETEANRRKIIQGHLDTKLNATGVHQAELVAEALRDVPFNAAFSSDLSRASATAEAILRHHPGVGLVQQEILRERFLGELQGHTIPAKGWGNSTVERSDAFAARAIKWWKATILAHVASLPDAAAEGANADAVARVLVVSHGGFINVLIQGLVGARHARCAPGVKTGLSCVNTAVCEVEVEGEKGIVLRYGDVSHLTERVEQPNADIFAEP